MFTLPSLPYALDGLSPFISAETLALHHGKHHNAYIEKLNGLLPQHDAAVSSLEDVIFLSHADQEKQSVFNNAAQCWNHGFLWSSMAPGGGGVPSGAIADLIRSRFGDFETFRDAFAKEAVGHFGSGWIWLVLENGKLEIMTTHDADLPLVHGHTALLTCDLWEHAYYVDYQNRRPDYVQAFLDHLVNWDFANANLMAVASTETARDDVKIIARHGTNS